MTEINICAALIFSPSGRQMLLQESLDTKDVTRLAPPDIIAPPGADAQAHVKKLLQRLIGLENLDTLGNKQNGTAPPIECGHISYRYLDKNGAFRRCTVTVFAHVTNPIGIVQPQYQMPLHWAPTWDYMHAAPDGAAYDVSHGLNAFVKPACDLLAPLRAASPVPWQPLGPRPYAPLEHQYYLFKQCRHCEIPRRAFTAMKSNQISLGTAYAMTEDMWRQIPGIGTKTYREIRAFLEETIDSLHFPLDIGTGANIDTKGGGNNEPAETE